MIKIKPKKLTIKEAEKLLKQKTMLFATWDCENKKHYLYQSLYPPFKDIFKEVVMYDTKIKNFEYGSHLMRKNLISLIREKKPNSILFGVWGCGEFESIDLIEEINKASPKTIIVGLFTDDERDFEISSRYYAMLLDYNIVNQVHYVEQYKKEGYRAFPSFGIYLKNFKPLGLKKKYNISFIGAPIAPRIKLMRYLINKGIKVNIWGNSWFNYPEFKDFYRGMPDDKEFVKIINESKINLSPSKNMYGEPHFKGRVLEFGACRSFALVDYFSGYLKYFKENKEIVFAKDDEDLLKKINYYLRNEKEREEIARNTYKKVVKNHDISAIYKKMFTEIIEEQANLSRKQIPKTNDKVLKITKKDMKRGFNYVKEKLKSIQYVGFIGEDNLPYNYKDYFQAHCLEKTKKDISCCDYYLCFNKKENYLRFRPARAMNAIKKEYFNRLIILSQLMTTKDYFLNNFEKFKKAFDGETIDFISENNTAFIDIPLLKITSSNKNIRKTIRDLGIESLDKAFQLNFIVRLYPLVYQKRVFSDSYLYKLVIKTLLEGNGTILKYLYNAYFNEGNWTSLKNISDTVSQKSVDEQISNAFDNP